MRLTSVINYYNTIYAPEHGRRNLCSIYAPKQHFFLKCKHGRRLYVFILYLRKDVAPEHKWSKDYVFRVPEHIWSKDYVFDYVFLCNS